MIDVQLVSFEDQPDGSAILTVELNREALVALATIGLQSALEKAAMEDSSERRKEA